MLALSLLLLLLLLLLLIHRVLDPPIDLLHISWHIGMSLSKPWFRTTFKSKIACRSQRVWIA
jgi:hypothetical protein